jgi:hypothetical protein
MMAALKPALPHTLCESTRFSRCLIRRTAEFASCFLDFRFDTLGSLRSIVPRFVLAFFLLLVGVLRGATGR